MGPITDGTTHLPQELLDAFDELQSSVDECATCPERSTCSWYLVEHLQEVEGAKPSDAISSASEHILLKAKSQGIL